MSAAGAMGASRREDGCMSRVRPDDRARLPEPAGVWRRDRLLPLSGWCTQVMTAAPGGLEMEDPREMRWWAARLMLIGGVFGTFGRASDAGRGRGASVLLVMGAASVVMVMVGLDGSVWRTKRDGAD